MYRKNHYSSLKSTLIFLGAVELLAPTTKLVTPMYASLHIYM